DDETELAIGSEAKHLADGAKEHEVVARRRGHADESPQRLAVRASGFHSREDRDEQIGPPRKRSILGGIDAEDQGAPVSFVDEPAERRRQGRLRAKMRLGSRVVDEDEVPAMVERQRGPTEEVVQPDGDRLEPRVISQAIDAIAVLLAEEKAPAPWIDREAPENGPSDLVGERDDDARHTRGVDRQGRAEVEAVDLARRLTGRPGAQHHEPAAWIESELARARTSGGHRLHAD